MAKWWMTWLACAAFTGCTQQSPIASAGDASRAGASAARAQPDRVVPARALVAAPTVAADEPDTLHSASLAGVAEDADATPADLADPATWQLPGGLSAAVTRDWLAQRFGTANVKVARVPGAEGESSRGIVLFPADPGRRAYLYFQDPDRLRGLGAVRILDAASHWHLDNGVGIGMSLSELVERNGKPLGFTGFDWDYGGVVEDWGGGRLQPAKTDPVRRNIRLDHRATGRYPMGDASFSSSDPRYPQLGHVVIVGEIGVTFPDRNDL